MSDNSFFGSLNVIKKNEAQQAAASPPPTSATGTSVPLLSEIVKKMPRKSRGVAHNIYLSSAVTETLKAETKKRGMAKSKLIDEVLKRVLGVEN